MFGCILCISAISTGVAIIGAFGAGAITTKIIKDKKDKDE